MRHASRAVNHARAFPKNKNMKTGVLSKLWIFLLLATQISCNKEIEIDPPAKQQPPVPLPDMVACHGTTAWDSLTIHTNLLGKWEWEYIQCFWNPEDGNNEDFRGMLVEFKPDNTLEVKVNGQITQTSTWKVANLNDGYWGITVSPVVIQLPGRILFCDERVLFNDSYLDGCDNYFKSKN